MTSGNKHWAEQYVNDPLTAPDPSDETGLNSSFRPDPESVPSSSARPVTPTQPRRLSKNNPFRQDHGSAKETSATAKEVRPDRSYPSPPPSASPRLTSGSPRQSPRASSGHRGEFLGNSTRPRRSSSLRERYPGDTSVNPLDQLAREKAEADRARHLTKKHAVRPDLIDGLDSTGIGHYHHEGPYDATLFARNNSWKSSPVAAVARTNEEALKATPHEKVMDSVQRHRPLDGVAAYPPGTTDRNGQRYDYTEGENMMLDERAEGGAYKRWAGVQYHPDDIKGKGEPSYSIEKALKEHSLEEKDNGGIEMSTNRSRSGSTAYRNDAFGEEETSLGRSGSLSNKLKKRVGSLRKRLSTDHGEK